MKRRNHSSSIVDLFSHSFYGIGWSNWLTIVPVVVLSTCIFLITYTNLLVFVEKYGIPETITPSINTASPSPASAAGEDEINYTLISVPGDL